MAKKRTGYVKVSIKKELLEPVGEFIKENPQLGYRSLAQFIEDAIRRRADELHIFDKLFTTTEIPLVRGVTPLNKDRRLFHVYGFLREGDRTELLEEEKKKEKKEKKK